LGFSYSVFLPQLVGKFAARITFDVISVVSCCVGKVHAVLLSLLLFSFALPLSAETAINVASVESAYDRGDYATVINELEPNVQKKLSRPQTTEQFEQALLLADAYQQKGMHAQSQSLLLSLRDLIESEEKPTADQARLYGQLAQSYQAMGNYDAAMALLNKAISIAELQAYVALQASLLNDLGNLYVAKDDLPAAKTAYRDSLAVATGLDEASLIATPAINLSRALLETGELEQVPELLAEANIAVTRMPPAAAQLRNRLALGVLYQRAGQQSSANDELRLAASDQWRAALLLAEELDDERSKSYALGYLGGLYEEEQRYEEALTLNERAVLIARQANVEEAIYQWEWQTARCLVQLGDVDGGLAAYRRAVSAIGDVRARMMSGTRQLYRDQIGPLYFEMADLLLRRTATLQDVDQVQANLLEIRQTLETLKTAEIVDYFNQDCVLLDQNQAALEQLSSNATVIYPILLDDRLELLVSFPGEIRQLTVPVSRDELTQVVRQFRLNVEDVNSGMAYLEPGQQLYQWLIAPLEPYLAGREVDTLVFVPDGPLRTIPMSALHDGQQFLVEKYALATTPGISLTSTQPIKREGVEVLANGITESVQGFSALPNVAEELQVIETLYPTRVNQDNNFQLASVERSMAEGSYSIVHIATHGQFDSDHKKSFLLTYDDKMTMDKLEEALNVRRYQDEAIELLVLSACQTAAGDDRAALGMAGIALKAGARSALATLWFINDKSTAELMQDFYTNLNRKTLTKAESLQLAQIDMLGRPESSHPAHWAPFLLIGNWL
jgi:CHAT domain-containing protein